MSRILDYIKKPYFCLILLYGRIIPKTLKWDKKFLKLMYKYVFRKEIDFEAPRSFNEKMQWLKLYDREPIYTTMVDKYLVKDCVGSIIGKEYIIPTLGVWDKFDDIDFKILPNQFVLKCTHDSGGLLIVKDKNTFDWELGKKKIEHCLQRNYYLNSREWPYKDVKPRILAEQYMEDGTNSSIKDYKFFCFNGKVKYILVCTDRDRELKETFFDINWNKAPFKRKAHDSEDYIEKPANLSLMIQLAERLANHLKFIRIDLYEINKRVYFGEMTFYPSSGFAHFEPEQWDLILGDNIKL